MCSYPVGDNSFFSIFDNFFCFVLSPIIFPVLFGQCDNKVDIESATNQTNWRISFCKRISYYCKNIMPLKRTEYCVFYTSVIFSITLRPFLQNKIKASLLSMAFSNWGNITSFLRVLVTTSTT